MEKPHHGKLGFGPAGSRIQRREPESKHRLQRREKPERRKAFQRQEDATADAIPGGRKTVGSGNQWNPSKKGDATGDIWRAEDKVRAKKGARSITIKQDDLDGIDHQAMRMHQVSVFVFGFSDGYNRASFRMDDAKIIMHIVSLVRRGEDDEAARLAETLV